MRARSPREVLILGLAAAAAAIVAMGSSFLAWITTPMVTGGSTAITGWGTIVGGDDLVNGLNINDIMVDEGGYQPGMVVLVAGGVAVFAGLILAATTAGNRPPRLLGAVLVGSGLVTAGFGLWKIVSPGDLIGLLPADDIGVGMGPIVALLAGLAVVAAGVIVFRRRWGS